jgi:hypothetical protein
VNDPFLSSRLSLENFTQREPIQRRSAGRLPSDPIRQRFGFRWWRKSATCAREGTVGRAFDLISVKVTLTEVEGNPSMVCHFRHDERRHAGSAFNIKNYGANHAHGFN